MKKSQNENNANMKDATKVITKQVRFNDLHVWEPVAFEEGQPKEYSVSLLIPKSDIDTIKKIEEAIDAAARAVARNEFGNMVPHDLMQPLRDGDLSRPGEE